MSTTLYPIGDLGTFTGVFDGGGHYVRDAIITQPGNNNVGIFMVIGPGSEIRNFGVENVAVSGRDAVGGLVGCSQGTVTGCYATGAVTGGGSYGVGGLVGHNQGGTVTNCYAAGTTAGAGSQVGGLVGWCEGGVVEDCYATTAVTGGEDVGGLVGQELYGTVTGGHATGTVQGWHNVGGAIGTSWGATVTDCYATGAVTGSGGSVGGLMGANGGTVTDCYAMGAVTGPDAIGGLIGWSYNNSVTGCYATGGVMGDNMVGGLIGRNGDYGSTVSACYAAGTVTGGSNVGGLIGWIQGGPVTDCYARGEVTGDTNIGGLVGLNDLTVTNCYATGAVSGDTNVGGLVGSGGTVTACFWDITTGGPDNGLGTGLPTQQMKQRTTFESAGWDYTGPPPVWYIFDGESYPYLFGLQIFVSFYANPRIGGAPLTVQFTDASNPGILPIETWHWDFGDGGTSDKQNPVHVYEDPGEYTVSLSASNTIESGTITRENYIQVAESMPVLGWTGLALVGTLLCLCGLRAVCHREGSVAHCSIIKRT